MATLLEQAFDAVGELVGPDAQDGGGALDEVLVGAQPGEAAFTREGLDATHVGGDRSFGDDLDGADHAEGTDMGTATQLDRTVARFDDAHDVAVLVTEEGDGPRLVGLVFRRHGGLRGIFRQFRVLVERMRHQRRGLRGRGERGSAGGDTCDDLEKFPTFHDSLLQSRVMRNKFRCAVMNAR